MLFFEYFLHGQTRSVEIAVQGSSRPTTVASSASRQASGAPARNPSVIVKPEEHVEELSEYEEPQAHVGVIIARIASINQKHNHLLHTKILDSGTDCHVWNNADDVEITRRPSRSEYIMAGASTVPITGYGTVKVPIQSGSITKLFRLK
jgi:hypothetical protein